MHDPLATYLKDHHAGARFAIGLLERLREENASGEWLRFATELLQDIKDDRAQLEELVARAGTGRSSPIKEGGAWIAERGARLKLSATRGVLGQLQTLEVLALGIQGKLALWNALSAISNDDARLRDVDFERLKERAHSQHARVEERRLALARRMVTDSSQQTSD